MTYAGGQGQGQGQGNGRGQGPWRPPGGERDGGRDRGVWWLAGGVALLVVSTIVAALVLVIMLGEAAGRSAARADGPPLSATASPRTSAPTFAAPAPRESGSPAPAAPAKSPRESFPAVRQAADLPVEQRRSLGTDVEVGASALRYVVMDLFDAPIYNCVFSVDLENVSDLPLTVMPAFRSVGAPRVQWSDDHPTRLEPGERSELIVGWDGLSPEEVGLTREQCTGPVELTGLEVTPG